MGIITLGNNGLMHYTYPYESGSASPIYCKPYALEELMEEYKNMRSKLQTVKLQYYNARTATSVFVRTHTFAELKTLHNELQELQEQESELCEEVERHAIALDGMRGAIRYYQALRVNSVLEEVLPKYSGKRAGDKTRQKFWEAVATHLPNKPSLYNHYYMTLTIYDNVAHIDSAFYTAESLGDNDNRFNMSYRVNVPQDAFNGVYPADWLVWATHVMNANSAITERYNELREYAGALRTGLCIGDTKMRSIEYDACREE